MDENSRGLDQLLRQYWRQPGQREELLDRILPMATTSPPSDLMTAGRCIQLLDSLVLPDPLKPRLDEFRERVGSMRLRAHQLDMLGDRSTPPEALFEALGEATDHLALDGFDSDELNRTRIGKRTRVDAAVAMLQSFGWERLPGTLGSELQQVASVLVERGQEYQGNGLFVDSDGVGFILGLKVSPNESGVVEPFVSVDAEMAHEASVALRSGLGERGAKWDIEWPLTFEGRSIGLGLLVAALVADQQTQPDPLLAATGQVDVNGLVLPVSGIEAKLNAALAAGMRRVLLPSGNRVEAEADPAAKMLELVYVASTSEIVAALSRASASTQIGFDGMVRFIRNLLPLYAVDVVDERSLADFYRFDVADARSEANLNVYGTGKLVVGGPQGTARENVGRLKVEHFDAKQPQPRQAQSFKVRTDDRQTRLRKLLVEAGASDEGARQSELWRYRLADGPSQALVILYQTGTCTLTAGTAPAYDRILDMIAEVLGGLTNRAPEGGPLLNTKPKQANPEIDETRPHIGTDEAGKGDFFGPMVSAAVFLPGSQVAEHLRAIGVRDSKLLSDLVVRKLASDLRSFLGKRASVVQLPPKTFNDLYAQMRSEGKNLNTLLAWAHARSIENLIGAGIRAEFVVVDKFADARYIERKILADTRETGIPIIQVTKAETHTAVAAASILARDAFLTWLEQQSAELGWQIPKGASDLVVEAGKRLINERGREALREFAKTSFRTTERVLST